MSEGLYPMPINIIVAHALEAKALVPMLSLEREQSPTEFMRYSNSNGLCLLVSGIGKAAITSAVTYLGEQQGNEDGAIRAWLNVGIAGHRNASLGSAWIGSKITDLSAASSAYPPQLVEGIRVGPVVTVDEPENTYPLDAAYEMEASAFYAEATKYSTAELVQVFKVISDNLENPISSMDLTSVPKLIARQEPELTHLIASLGAIAAQHNTVQSLPKAYHEICANTRLSVNQKLQLKRLSQRHSALGLETELARIAAMKGVDARKLLQELSLSLEGGGDA